jgi:TPR repeat protein
VDLKRQGLSGSVLVQAPVRADGSSRTPRALYSYPLGAFDEAGRAVALASRYSAEKRNGVSKRCSILFKVKFTQEGVDWASPGAKSKRIVADLRDRAVAGDPLSQMSYGAVLELWPVFDEKSERVLQWFLKAAQAGLPAAQFMIGVRLIGGSGFEEDRAKGEFWLELAAEGGSGAAQAALASYLLVKDADPATRDRGFEWMRRSSETEHREGKFLFASLLVSWPDPARRDPARALKLVEEVGKSFDYDPAVSEIRASALAAQGDFKAAQRAQTRAIVIARQLDWDVSQMQARLRAYESNQVLEGELIEF